MSVVLVSDESLTRTRNSLIHHLKFSSTAADSAVIGWASLNRYVITLCGGDTYSDFKFTDTNEVNSSGQMLKSLRYLQWQCNDEYHQRSIRKNMHKEWFSILGVALIVKNKFKIDEDSQIYIDATWA